MKRKSNIDRGCLKTSDLNNKMWIYFILIILLFNTACRKYLEIDPPKSQILTPVVFSTNETATAAMFNVYNQMLNSAINPYFLSSYTGISGDELTNYSVARQAIYRNAISPNDGSIGAVWNLGFNAIYQANSVYDGCQSSTDLHPDVKKQLMAEALFIRAYWHFYLYNLYGDIPIIKTTDYTINAQVPRSSKTEVFKLIISDLNAAITNLSEDYLAADGLNTSEERIRPNKYAAMALLARAYLYNEENAKAEEQTTLIISNSSMYSLVELKDVFLANSKEAIWQLKATTPTGINTPEGASYILTASPVTISGLSLSSQLIAAFDSGDLRKDVWVGTFTDNSNTYYYPYKYKIKFGNDIKEYSMIFRLAEQYLIRAEARVRLGKINDAISDIDVIRKRSGLPLIMETNANINKAALLTLILKERQVELFTEQCHRWMDLKRTGRIDDVMGIITPLKGGGAWNATKQLWPVPLSEIKNNPNLKQNEGYN